jgi:hypothetical protein
MQRTIKDMAHPADVRRLDVTQAVPVELLLDAADRFHALLKEIVNAEHLGQDNM